VRARTADADAVGEPLPRIAVGVASYPSDPANDGEALWRRALGAAAREAV